MQDIIHLRLNVRDWLASHGCYVILESQDAFLFPEEINLHKGRNFGLSLLKDRRILVASFMMDSTAYAQRPSQGEDGRNYGSPCYFQKWLAHV